MFKNYFKTAYRSLMKNRATSIINVLGLSIGISAALIIFLIIQYEYSFDKWEPNKDKIYRVYTQWGELGTNAGVSSIAPPVFSNKITGLDVVAHFFKDAIDDGTIEVPAHGNIPRKLINKTDGVYFADDNFFKIFPYKWIVGSPIALSKLGTTVLTASTAKSLFPNEDLHSVVGRALVFNDSINTIVGGIVAELQQKTDIDCKIFISLKTMVDGNLLNNYGGGTPGWTNVSYTSQCYVKLHEGTDSRNVDAQLKKLYASNIKKDKPTDFNIYGRLQPLAAVHLDPHVSGDAAKKNLRNTASLALVLILLASINFINLTTAQSSLRAKEIGVRKTFGSNKKQIIQQFLIETFLLVCVATIIAFVLYPIFFYLFKDFIPEKMPLSTIRQPLTVIYILILIALLTLMAGIYPAFVMSRYQPIQALKGKINKGGKTEKIWLRQSLIVLQFLVAQVFLIIVLIVGKQIHYVLEKDMGFKKDAIVSFYTPWNEKDKRSLLYHELTRVPGIKDVSLASGTPALNGYSTTRLTYFENGTSKDFNNVHVRSIDENYLSVFGLQLMAGSNIKVDTASKIPEVLINETLMKSIGFRYPANAIGHYISGGNADTSKIVGVVKDFNVMSLENPMQPVIMFANNFGYASNISIAFASSNPSDWQATLKTLTKIYKDIYTGKDINYNFFDSVIKSMYDKYIRMNVLLRWATGLSIFISCMGLIGLVMFMANQRTKEIGIRKVLGASIPQILRLLSNNLIGLIVLASVIAFPIAWYFSHGWLQDFAYKTTLSWWVFPLCALGMLLVALIILWSWSLKAAKANPANVLRTE
ncbi:MULTISPECIES: ABC transporter permease [Chitinophagaceae]